MTKCQAILRGALCGAYKYTGALYFHEQLAQLSGQEFMSILLFHRVTDLIPEDCLTVSTRRFHRICRLLARKFHVVRLSEIFRILRSGLPMPPRTVAITFDDSYRDNLDAARVLADHGLPATFFLPTDFIGSERRFLWDRHLPPLPNLTWDDVHGMVRLGFDIGSHTVSHANLGVVHSDRAWMELSTSRTILEDRIERPVRWFAYPFGGRDHFRSDYLPMIREAGYEGAVSAFGGFVKPHSDDLVLPREAVPYFRSVVHLEMYLSGCLNWYYALKGQTTPSVFPPWPYLDYSHHLKEIDRQPLCIPTGHS